MQLMLQATICDCLARDPFAFEEDGLGASEVDVSGGKAIVTIVPIRERIRAARGVRRVTAIPRKLAQTLTRKIRLKQARGVSKEENPMFKTVSTIAVAAALSLLSSAALAEQGTK
jgi:hypothetical protein